MDACVWIFHVYSYILAFYKGRCFGRSLIMCVALKIICIIFQCWGKETFCTWFQKLYRKHHRYCIYSYKIVTGYHVQAWVKDIMPGYNYLTIASGYAKRAKLFIVNSDVAKRETYLALAICGCVTGVYIRKWNHTVGKIDPRWFCSYCLGWTSSRYFQHLL